jgi:uncharacterized membrane protein
MTTTPIFSTKEALTFGWETFKKDPWFYVGVTVSLTVFSMVVNALTGGGHGIGSVLGFVISYLASTVVTIAYVKLALSATATDGTHVGWDGLWAPEHFFNMLGATILQSVIILVGLVLLIVPGIIASLVFVFTQLALVDKKLDPIAALKESYRLTKGHVWQLFVFTLTIVAVNIVGFLALVIGLMVTIPVSIIAAAHVYRKFSAMEEPVVITNEATPAQ